jgi:predicted secreted protein
MVTCRVKAMIVSCVALVLLLGLGSTALAASFSDVDSATAGSYGISPDELSRVSNGYPDGTWQPWRMITRAQFTKMADAAFAIPTANPSTPTFTDVDFGDYFYTYIEGAHAAGLVKGVAAGVFAPLSPIIREQAIAIAARQVATDEDFNLSSLTEDEITADLSRFSDAGSISTGLRPEVAFAVTRRLIEGNKAGVLAPGATITRVSAAALLLRAMEPSALWLDESDNGTTVSVKVGSTIKVVLKGNPTTGYGWTPDLSEADAAILQEQGGPEYVPDSNLIGAGGTYTFTFLAVATGNAQLKLVYLRPWESVPPLKTFSVNVKVEKQPLDGTSWRLEGWSIDSLSPGDFTITANFEGGHIGGQAAVNSYGAAYAAGPDDRFSVGTIVHTMMAGSEPAMRAENLYYELLGQARKYEVAAGKLTLTDANGNELLIFKPAS